VAENPFDGRRKRVLRLIAAAGEQGLSRSEPYAKTRALTTRERTEVLEALLLCGDIREVAPPRRASVRTRGSLRGDVILT